MEHFQGTFAFKSIYATKQNKPFTSQNNSNGFMFDSF